MRLLSGTRGVFPIHRKNSNGTEESQLQRMRVTEGLTLRPPETTFGDARCRRTHKAPVYLGTVRTVIRRPRISIVELCIRSQDPSLLVSSLLISTNEPSGLLPYAGRAPA